MQGTRAMNDYLISFMNSDKFTLHHESVEVATDTTKQAIKIAKAKLPNPRYGQKWHLRRVICNDWNVGFDLTDL